MSTTTRPFRVSLCETRSERTQQGNAITKEGLKRLLLLQLLRDPSEKTQYVLHLTPRQPYLTKHSSYLWPGVPQSHNWVNAAGSQEAVTGVRLETVHDGLISLQHSNKVGGFFLPDEEGAVI